MASGIAEAVLHRSQMCPFPLGSHSDPQRPIDLYIDRSYTKPEFRMALHPSGRAY